MGTVKKRIRYEYDALGNRSAMVDPEGGRFTYHYDAASQMTAIQNPQSERTSYTYNANGQQATQKLASGIRTSFSYDANGQTTSLTHFKSDNTIISKLEYQYNSLGNQTSVAELDGSRTSWTYDQISQLTGEHRTGTSPYQNSFSYDSTGNRTLKNEDGARTTYSYDVANQLQTSLDASGTTAYSYDNNGNQQLVVTPAGGRTTTLWDAENKTTSVQLPAGIRNTMSYEPDGLRIQLEESTGTKKFIWDDQNYLAEADANNNIQVTYTNAIASYGKLISKRQSIATSYYLFDKLGSTRSLTDANEAITDTYLYDAWGNLINSTGSIENPFQWTGNVGYYFDKESGNFYIRARTYKPTIGRWLSSDPLGFVDGLNLHMAYFIPNGIDPSGMIGGWGSSGIPYYSRALKLKACVLQVCCKPVAVLSRGHCVVRFIDDGIIEGCRGGPSAASPPAEEKNNGKPNHCKGCCGKWGTIVTACGKGDGSSDDPADKGLADDLDQADKFSKTCTTIKVSSARCRSIKKCVYNEMKRIEGECYRYGPAGSNSNSTWRTALANCLGATPLPNPPGLQPGAGTLSDNDITKCK
ncbi:MAG: RHS repeat-associated core domain-containing protein [Planctomycetaceae bacterium]|nr:RHS repeat-associated core domain-containing protein [Planctomycetaceae bacterium]